MNTKKSRNLIANLGIPLPPSWEDSWTPWIESLHIQTPLNYLDISSKISSKDLQIQNASDFESYFSTIQDQVLALMVGSDEYELMGSLLNRVPVDKMRYQCADTFFLENGKWWPKCFLKDILTELISFYHPNINNRDRAYVTGSGMWMRVACAVLSSMGFEKINIVLQDGTLKSREEILSFMDGKFFNLSLELMHHHDLILRPNDGNILIHTDFIQNSKELYDDLIYLNFLKSNSLIINFDPRPDNILTLEVQSLPYHSIPGHYIWIYYQYYVLQKLFYDKWKVSKQDFLKSFH